MITLKFDLKDSISLTQYFQKQLRCSLKNDILTLNGEVGTGTIRITPIQNGLFIMSFDCIDNNVPIVSIRLPSEQNDYFVLNFHLLNTGLHVLSQEKSKVLNTNYNVVLESSMLASQVNVNKNTPIQLFCIVMSNVWIKENLFHSDSKENDFIKQIFTHEKAIYFLEVINYKLSSPINSIFKRKSMNRIETFSDVLLILKHFLEKIKHRNNFNSSLSISSEKLKSILKSKAKIEDCWRVPISINNIAKEAGMSLSGYRRSFKHVLGVTPYQYYLKYKMIRAIELLESKKYSISEVGHMVGYSNLGQFSKIFKRVHSFSPKDVK